MESTLKRNIPLFTPTFTGTEIGAMQQVIADGYLNEGKYVREAEKLFAEHVGASYCLMVPNGALALLAAVTYYSVRGPWRVPSNYGIFAANAAHLDPNNNDPHIEISDVSRQTGCMDDEDYEDCEPLPVHVNGRIAKTIGQIEDCGQAISFHRKDTFSCHSFHSTKIITCAGAGGAICCDKKEDYESLYAIKDHGRPDRAQNLKVTDKHTFVGTNMKMTDIDCSFFIEQLKDLPRRKRYFSAIYHLYRDLLGDSVEWLHGEPEWRIDILVPNPTTVVDHLAKNGIGSQRFYLPVHKQPAFEQDGSGFPNTNYLYEHGIYLPSSATLGADEVHYICNIVKEALK